MIFRTKHSSEGLPAQAGFTLIELLVVIAIIGILAAIILVSLSSARAKAGDAKVESQSQSIQQAAELYYNSHQNSYNAGVTTDVTCTGMEADTASGLATLFTASSWPDGTLPICATSADGSSYFVYHPLSSDPTQFWCVDSTGDSKLESSAPTGPAC